MQRYHAARSNTAGAQTKPEPKPLYKGPVNQSKTPTSGPIYGDDAADPYVIPALPFWEQSSTDGFNDDYDEVCESGASTSPDVVYYFYSDHDQYINVDLCNSWYDTKLFLAYASDPYSYFACNDDACGLDLYKSRIETIRLAAGDEILIVVDGFGGDYGDYEISVYEVTGEDEFDPIVIPQVPFTSAFSTEFKINDYDESCPDASTSNDVVYLFEPQVDMAVTMNVCNASYDTKLFIYEGFINPGSPFACNEDSPLCTDEQFHSLIECIQLTAYTSYYIIVDGWENQSGQYVLDIQECDLTCWTGCAPEAVLESEPCDREGYDDYNGGCYEGDVFELVEPGQLICGTMPEVDGLQFDTDWYLRYMFEGDSVTWCVTGNFNFESAIMNVTDGCQPNFEAFSAGNQCDTTYLGYRIPADGLYSFMIQPYPFDADWPCENDPSYQAQLIVNPKCEWGFCPLVSIPENEGCDVNEFDDFNRGCYINPAVFTELPDNQYVCGLSWRYAGNWDEDAYRWHAGAGETVNFTFQAEFPAAVYVYDIGTGAVCDYSQQLAFYETVPCDIISFDILTPTATDLAFIVLIRDVYNYYHCDTGPWEYVLIANGRSACPEFVCDPAATLEGEGCEITKSQGYNAGCNSVPPTYSTIAYDETVCGTAWYGGAGFNVWRDTDWHDADVADGDSVVWCVTAEFPFDAFIIHVSPGCVFAENYTVAYDTGYACDTIYLTARQQPGQDLRFAIAPRFFFPWLWCEFGDWNWQATLTKVNESCACDCAHDPECNGVTNLNDVVHVVNVAFRGGNQIPDPNGECPWQTTDVNCDGVTNLNDVARVVNVSFRGADPNVQFCDPCVSDNLTTRQ